MLEEKGVRIYRNAKLMEIIQDEDGLEAVLFKMLDLPEDNSSDEDELEGKDEAKDEDSNMGSG